MRSWTWSETVGTSKRGALGFARPDELRVEMRIVGVGLLRRSPGPSPGDQPDRRIVRPLLALVRVLLDRLFLGVLLAFFGFAISLILRWETLQSTAAR